MTNAETAQRAIAEAITKLPVARSCECGSALQFALITRPDAIRRESKATLRR